MTEPRPDDGSVLLMVLGTVVVLGLLLAVIVDTGRLYLARRSLDGVADAAALAGVQAVDLDAVYAGNAGTDLPLDEGAVRRAIDDYLRAADVDHELEGFRLDEVIVTADEVTIRATSAVRLPFVGPFTDGTSTVVVRTSATARNRVAASS